jgi:hypothetical protein
MPDTAVLVTSEEESRPSANVKFLISSYPAHFTIELLVAKMGGDQPEIEIPDWQRGFVWSLRQASELIDSCLRGLPIPQLFLYRDPKTESLIVVDGNQRLKTIQGFFEGVFPGNKREFALDLPNTPWNGLTFKTLGTKEKKGLKNYVLPATLIRQDSPKDDSSVFYIFDRLNTGGTQLTPQEVRNAVYRGDLNSLLHELNGDSSWRQLFGSTTPHNRMRDRELILRFLALNANLDKYEKPMDEFLNSYLGSGRTLSDTQKDQFSKLFRNVCGRALGALGPKPFRLKTALNVAVFDSVFVAMARSNRTPTKASFQRLLDKDGEYFKLVSKATTDADNIRKRIAIAEGACV